MRKKGKKKVQLDSDVERGKNIKNKIPMIDVREKFLKLSHKSVNEKAEVESFLENRKKLITKQHGLNKEVIERSILHIDGILSSKEDEDEKPIPGGVGFGFYYQNKFKENFQTGAGVQYHAICPPTPGGNVNTWLYLTATNRCSGGVEALIYYHSQEELQFKIFDWARKGKEWQLSVPLQALKEYLTSVTEGEVSYPAMQVKNLTFQKQNGQWCNEVYLYNFKMSQLALVYSYDYPSTLTDQKSGWAGSWAPIVETFQANYSDTNPLGFANISVSSRDVDNNWGQWEELTSTYSYEVKENQGFVPIVLNPNFTFIVQS